MILRTDQPHFKTSSLLSHLFFRGLFWEFTILLVARKHVLVSIFKVWKADQILFFSCSNSPIRLKTSSLSLKYALTLHLPPPRR